MARKRYVLLPPIDRHARFDPIEIPGLAMADWPIWSIVFLTELRLRNNVSRAALAAGVSGQAVRGAAERSRSFHDTVSEIKQGWMDDLVEANEDRARDGVLKPVFQGGKQVGHVREYDASIARAALAANVPKYSRAGETGDTMVALVRIEDQEKLRDPAVLEAASRLAGLMSGQRALPEGALQRALGTRERPIDVTPAQKEKTDA